MYSWQYKFISRKKAIPIALYAKFNLHTVLFHANKACIDDLKSM